MLVVNTRSYSCLWCNLSGWMLILGLNRAWGCSDTNLPTLASWSLKNRASSESGFLLRLQMVVPIWSQQHFMEPIVQTAGGIMMAGMFSWYIGALILVNHGLNVSLREYCCWPCLSLYDHSLPSFNQSIDQSNFICIAHIHKSQFVS